MHVKEGAYSLGTVPPSLDGKPPPAEPHSAGWGGGTPSLCPDPRLTEAALPTPSQPGPFAFSPGCCGPPASQRGLQPPGGLGAVLLWSSPAGSYRCDIYYYCHCHCYQQQLCVLPPVLKQKR